MISGSTENAFEHFSLRHLLNLNTVPVTGKIHTNSPQQKQPWINNVVLHKTVNLSWLAWSLQCKKCGQNEQLVVWYNHTDKQTNSSKLAEAELSKMQYFILTVEIFFSLWSPSVCPVWYIHDMCSCMFAARGLPYSLAVCSCLMCHLYVYMQARFCSMSTYEILCAHSCKHFHIVSVWVCMCSLPKASRQVGLPQGSLLPQCCQNQSPTVSKDTGKASPLTGITMLQTRRKTPLIFNALLSGLKGTGTWRNCAAKCVFLCKARWIWAERKSEQGFVCLCVYTCASSWPKKNIKNLDLPDTQTSLPVFSADSINISTEPCRHLQTQCNAFSPQNSQWQVPH